MSTRFVYFCGFLATVSVLGTSLYLQFVEGFMPCPLCTLQRFSFVLLGCLFLLGTLFARKVARMFVNFLAVLTSLVGIVLAGRQMWLQHFPPADSSECGVSLQYMMQVLPLHEVAQKIFAGSAECTQRGWELLGLNTAEWALVWFVGFFVLTSYLLVREFK